MTFAAMMGNYYLLNLRWRWAAVCISKNACTALKMAVLRDEGIDCGEGKDAVHNFIGYDAGSLYLHPVSSGRPLGFHCFAVWRDPLDRFTSAYRHFALDKNWGRLGAIGPDPDDWIEYAATELRKDALMQDEHLRKQCDYYDIHQIDDLVSIGELSGFFQSHGWGELPHTNASRSQFAFTSGQVEKIRTLYAGDENLPTLHLAVRKEAENSSRKPDALIFPSRKAAGRKLSSASLAYPRMELPFIAEWLDYHLSLGVEHVFLGLHLNEEFSPRETLLPAKRPFPSLYRLDESEGDVLAEFMLATEPFRKRITTWLFPRRNSDVHGECGCQCDLYRRILEAHASDIEWLAVHDIDEFLVPAKHRTLTDVLDGLEDSVAGIRMRQVVCEARWTDERIPRTEPVLSLHRRIGQPMPPSHGSKMISRLGAAREIGIHGSVVDGEICGDDSVFSYHYRGNPGETEVTGYRLPVESEEFDMIDTRPMDLLRFAKSARATAPFKNIS